MPNGVARAPELKWSRDCVGPGTTTIPPVSSCCGKQNVGMPSPGFKWPVPARIALKDLNRAGFAGGSNS
jgi:hypothetical protein